MDRCPLKPVWNFTNSKRWKVSEKNARLLNNRSFVPSILRFKTFSKSKPRCQVFVPRDREQCGGCLAGLPCSALRPPAVPEVSGRLPPNLEAKSPACPISAPRAATHYVQNNQEGWGTWVWLPEAVAPRQPRAESDEAKIYVSLKTGAQMNCQAHFTAKWKSARKMRIDILSWSWSLDLESSKIHHHLKTQRWAQLCYQHWPMVEGLQNPSTWTSVLSYIMRFNYQHVEPRITMSNLYPVTNQKTPILFVCGIAAIWKLVFVDSLNGLLPVCLVLCIHPLWYKMFPAQPIDKTLTSKLFTPERWPYSYRCMYKIIYAP